MKNNQESIQDNKIGSTSFDSKEGEMLTWCTTSTKNVEITIMLMQTSGDKDIIKEMIKDINLLNQ
jgi:hypothetical protein